MPRLVAAILAAVAVAGTGCGSAPVGQGCRRAAPPTCPSPAPGYAANVAPLVTRLCRPCHTQGGVESTAALDSYEQVRARGADIQVRLESCLMPPADQPQPTVAEGATLLTWLVCGAQND